MTLYVVRAKPKGELMADLKKELNSGKISKIRPFGEELQHGFGECKSACRICILGGRRLLLSTPCSGKKKCA